MRQISAFVGHSFVPEDQAVVAKFIDFFDQMKGALPDFNWTHARAAEPAELAAKVLKLCEGKNAFIGICTRRERVVPDEKLRGMMFDSKRNSVAKSDLVWKTSDWVIQEIGLAVARGMAIILLVENGCRRPGGLQGDVEFIPFDRSTPERAFGPLLEMMKALSPKTGAGEVTSSDSLETTDQEIAQAATPENEVPDASWDRTKYEHAFLWKLYTEDDEGTKKIDDAFTASPYAVEREDLVSWNATNELWRIRFGKKGSLSQLRKYHDECPKNAEIAAALANGFAVLKMHSEAAEQYLKSSDLIPSDRLARERYRGLAAVQFTKAGDTVKSAELLRQRRAILATSTREEQQDYLVRAREITLESNDALAEIEILEELVRLTPDDWVSRFNLAYRYSQTGLNDLSLYHYIQIPNAERSAITWNNLGVAYQEFSMPAKAVSAYEESSSQKETLAMSNLAYKLMQAGFLKAADEELQKALKIDDFHRNVGEAISALKDIPDTEEKTLKDALQKLEPKRRFFQAVGGAIASADIEELPNRWIGPECELSVTIQGGKLLASGEYLRAGNALAGILSQKPTLFKVHYEGTIVGRRVMGTMTKKSEGTTSSSSLLGGLGPDGEREFVMVIDPGGQNISVAEQLSSNVPKFYFLEANGAILGAVAKPPS